MLYTARVFLSAGEPRRMEGKSGRHNQFSTISKSEPYHARRMFRKKDDLQGIASEAVPCAVLDIAFTTVPTQEVSKKLGLDLGELWERGGGIIDVLALRWELLTGMGSLPCAKPRERGQTF